MRRKLLLATTHFWVICFASLATSSHGYETSLTLVYTSNNMGEVEPCLTCPEAAESGGLPRRAHFIKTVRTEAKDLLILDAGDALAIDYFSRASEREKARKRAEVVLKLYEKMGYDALNIGDTDIGLGIEYMKNLQRRVSIPFLSANLKDKKTRKFVFNSYLIKDVGGAKIGTIGLLTPNIPSYLQKEMTNYLIEEPVKAALNLVQGPMSHCSHIFALAHLSPPEIESLAKEVPRISIIIGGNDRSFILPKKIQRSLYIQTDAFGAHIGRLNLNLIKGSSEFIDTKSKTLIQKKIEEAQKKIEESKYEKDINALKDLQAILIEQMKKMPSSKGKSTYENYLTLMHATMESDKEIENLIESSRDQLKRPIP